MSSPDAEEPAKTCFVAMPISTPADYADKLGDADHFQHVLAHLFTPALQAAGLEVIPPVTAGAEIMHASIIRNLETADYVLCDLSSLNPNVLFELGVRTSLDRPVILVRDNRTAVIPFDLNAISTATYDSSLKPWVLDAEIPRLADFIKRIVRSGNTSNAMWRYFGLTKRAVPSEAGDNPVEAKLDLIIAELGKNRQLSIAPAIQSYAAPIILVETIPDIDISVFSDLAGNALRRRGIEEFQVDHRPGVPGARVKTWLIAVDDPAAITGELLADLRAIFTGPQVGRVDVLRS